ncbi:hypothetical protein A2U01_0006774, partial [Trifolium medium]|nr:hypothetical protein [Trifolium medium]
STLQETNHLMQILKTYEAASGQEINMTKSERINSWRGRALSKAGKEVMIKWRIGNGSKIKVMSEPWLREKDGRWMQSPQPQGKGDEGIEQESWNYLWKIRAAPNAKRLLCINNYVWNGTKEPGQALGAKALFLWHEWRSVQSTTHRIMQSDLHQQQLQWQKSQIGWLKCKVDAGFHNDQTQQALGGVYVITRDSL